MQTQQIHNALGQLAERRPVFHSEADFQHALAWQLQILNPDAHIRLEKQVAAKGNRVHLDLLFKANGDETAIELKYKTKSAELVHSQEEFFLRNQSAQDISRHDFLKDVQRLERYVEANTNSMGFAILLTNDRTYWTESKKADSVDSTFRIHDGKVLAGDATWSAKASAGTKHKREELIKLRGSYPISWRKYSSFGASIAEEFRYILLSVAGDA